MLPVAPAAGAVMEQAVKLLGSGVPQAALTKVVYAGVLSLIFSVESGELLSFIKVMVYVRFAPGNAVALSTVFSRRNPAFVGVPTVVRSLTV